jgi:hypothetical protein
LPREAVTFEAPKVTKSACQQRGFSVAPGLCAANHAKPQAAILLPCFAHAFPPLQQKFANALSSRMPTIVLPDFARSFSADGRDTNEILNNK